MSASPPALPQNAPPLYLGRVSQNAFESLVGIFYGLAMVGALTRLVLQLKTRRSLQFDDCFLIFACICLTVTTVLSYTNVGDLYWSQGLNYNPSLLPSLMEQHVDIAARINAYQRVYNSQASLQWTVIFAVKFAYLAFFRRLVDRLRSLVIYWRIIVGLSAVSFPICVISIYISCWKDKHEAKTCLQPVSFNFALALALTDVVLDITTDLMIVSIPICLLWSVRIQAGQKFIIGIFLSLNLFIAIIAAIRVPGLKFHGTFDIIWLLIWQHIQACVAVIMISLTAFRSVYVSSQAARAQREPANKPWYSNTVAATRRKRALHRKDEEYIPGLPTIPSATLTGMRTFIQGGRRTGTGFPSLNSTTTREEEPEQWVLHERPAKLFYRQSKKFYPG